MLMLLGCTCVRLIADQDRGPAEPGELLAPMAPAPTWPDRSTADPAGTLYEHRIRAYGSTCAEHAIRSGVRPQERWKNLTIHYKCLQSAFVAHVRPVAVVALDP